jgi:hypothetical protein
VESLAKRLERGQVPDRHDVRAVLLALGVPEESAAGAPALARLRGLEGAAAESWGAAVADELERACEEHVLGVDPRYLGHPRFDFRYTLEARERLAARLRAAERLALPLPKRWLDAVLEADQRVAAELARRSADGDAPSITTPLRE